MDLLNLDMKRTALNPIGLMEESAIKYEDKNK